MSNNVIVRPHSQQMFTIYDLQPSTGYTVRITAHNSAGSSVNTYSCTTLPAGECPVELQMNLRKVSKEVSIVPLAIPGGAVSSDTVLAAAGGTNSKHADVWSLWSVCIFISVALGRILKGCQQ